MFAIPKSGELFGWGRNSHGQLGLGYISESVTEPTLIKQIAHKSIVKVQCGDNYSAVITSFGELFVTGCMKDGKLGLGEGFK